MNHPIHLDASCFPAAGIYSLSFPARAFRSDQDIAPGGARRLFRRREIFAVRDS